MRRGPVLDPALRYFGLCLGHTTAGQAERWVRNYGVPAGAEVCTHRLPDVASVVQLSIAIPAGTAVELPPVPAVFAAPAMRAAAAHAAGRSGRAVRFGGSTALAGTMTAGSILARSAIRQVITTAGLVLSPGDLTGPLDAARPVWRDGLLTLFVLPTPAGPFLPYDEAALPCDQAVSAWSQAS